MNRTARTLIALASATALAASVAVAAHAAQFDIGDKDLEIPKANALWESGAWTSYGFTVTEATIFADTVDPADPSAGDEVNEDAFDGVLGIWVEEGRYGLPDCTGTCTYIADVTSSSGDTLVQGPVEVLSGLEVSVQQRFYADGDLARVVATYTNPTGEPIAATTGAFSDYGSDSYTVLEGDSSGDGSVSETDHWIITGDDDTYNDPIITTAWSTAGATHLPDYAGLDDAVHPYWKDMYPDESDVHFELTVQPGQTVHLAYFVKIHGWESLADAPEVLDGELAAAATIASDYGAAITDAVAGAAEFSTFSGRLIAGLAPGTVVLNWGAAPTAPADPAAPATPVPGRPTFTG